MIGLPPLTDEEKVCSDILSRLIGTFMLADEQIIELHHAFECIASTYMAYDSQHVRIMNLIQQSLIDYKDKPYRY